MKQILIVSDSHGDTESLKRIKKVHSEVSLMIHCGDSELPAGHEAVSQFRIVKGNCDYDHAYSEEMIEQSGDLKIFITHGHLYSVKTTLMKLFYRAKEIGANIVTFGHSHILGAELIEDVLFINPGSILLPRKRTEKTYIILEIEQENATVKVYDAETCQEIVGLSRKFLLSKSS